MKHMSVMTAEWRAPPRYVKTGGKQQVWELHVNKSRKLADEDENKCLDDALPLASYKHSCCDGEMEGTFPACETHEVHEIQGLDTST